MVDNLPLSADVSMLQELFAPFGRIYSAKVEVAVQQSSSSAWAAGAAEATGAAVLSSSKGEAGGGRAAERGSELCSGRGTVQMLSGDAHAAVQQLNALQIRGHNPPIKVTLSTHFSLHVNHIHTHHHPHAPIDSLINFLSMIYTSVL